MTRWVPFVQLTVLTWALHRIAMALIGFPMFSISNFKLVEFVVDMGIYAMAFGISYWFLISRKRRKGRI